jgi:hypothetical protein
VSVVTNDTEAEARAPPEVVISLSNYVSASAAAVVPRPNAI